MEKLEWHNEKRKINDLIPTEGNPRKLTKKEAKELAEFYSHLKDEKIKELFRKSGLVIVDYNEAIENGWAELYDDLLNIIKKDEESD